MEVQFLLVGFHAFKLEGNDLYSKEKACYNQRSSVTETNNFLCMFVIVRRKVMFRRSTRLTLVIALISLLFIVNFSASSDEHEESPKEHYVRVTTELAIETPTKPGHALYGHLFLTFAKVNDEHKDDPHVRLLTESADGNDEKKVVIQFYENDIALYKDQDCGAITKKKILLPKGIFDPVDDEVKSQHTVVLDLSDDSENPRVINGVDDFGWNFEIYADVVIYDSDEKRLSSLRTNTVKVREKGARPILELWKDLGRIFNNPDTC
jgi:hypothetical protein